MNTELSYRHNNINKKSASEFIPATAQTKLERESPLIQVATDTHLFFKPSPTAINRIQRKCAHCEEEEKKQLQRKEKTEVEIEASGLLDNHVHNANDIPKEFLRAPQSIVQKEPGGTSGKPCSKPTSVELGDTYEIAYPDYLTGGGGAGICAVMKVHPESNLCTDSVREEVAGDKGTTCPDTLIRQPCSGASIFSPGKKQKLCDTAVSANEFTDRHSIQVEDVSVLHDKKRNPKKLKTCQFICSQSYHPADSKRSKEVLGRFQIVYELKKGTRDGKSITNVKATKKKI